MFGATWPAIRATLAVVSGRPERPGGLLARTAALLSRSVLPAAVKVVRHPHPTGQIRAAGRWFRAFYTLACLVWGAAGYVACDQVAGFWERAVRTRTESVAVTEAPPPLDPMTLQVLDFFREVILPHAGPFLALGLFVWLGVGYLMRQWDLLPVYRLRPWFFHVTKMSDLILVTLKIASAVLVVACALALAYPGLTTGENLIAQLPWQVWYGVLVALLVYRDAGAINRRAAEFLTPGALPVDTPHTWLSELVADVIRECRHPRTAKQTPAVCPIEGALGHDSRRLADLLAWRQFYEREGLNDLIDPANPERQYYTSEQRMAFDRAYSDLLVAIGELEGRIDSHRRRLSRRPVGAATVVDSAEEAHSQLPG